MSGKDTVQSQSRCTGLKGLQRPSSSVLTFTSVIEQLIPTIVLMETIKGYMLKYSKKKNPFFKKIVILPFLVAFLVFILVFLFKTDFEHSLCELS